MTARDRLPNRRSHELSAHEHAGLRFTAGVGRYGDGRLAELFANSEKAGTTFDAMLRDSAVLLSLALQYGADVQTIRRALVRNGDGSASGPIGVVLDAIFLDGGGA